MPPDVAALFIISAALGTITLFVLAGEYQWARNILGAMLFAAFIVFLLWVR